MSKRFIAIGNNNYRMTGADLAGCVPDAHAWADFLQQRGFFGQVVSDATGAEIRLAITDIVRQATSGDQVVITYSGHGSQVKDTDREEADGFDETLCGVDFDFQKPGSWVTDDWLYSVLSSFRHPGAKLLVVLDCCHSGSGTRLLNPSFVKARKIDNPESPGPVRRSFRKSITWTCLSACHDNQTAADAVLEGHPCGAFTQSLIRTVGGISWSDWVHKATNWLRANQFDQTPVCDSADKNSRVWIT